MKIKIIPCNFFMLTAMMMPFDMGGKEFILIDIPNRLLKGYYYITVTVEATVSIWTGDSFEEVVVKHNNFVVCSGIMASS